MTILDTPIADGSGRDVGSTEGGRRSRVTRRQHWGLASDRALIVAVRGGDGDAFAELYRRHVDDVGRLARRLARDRSEADDVTSEVFAKTLRAIRRGRGPVDDARPYLLRSVRNTLTAYRSNGDTARATPCRDEVLDRPTFDRVPVRGTAIDAFVDLPARFQQVLWWTEIEGATASEIADRELATDDVSAGAVASLGHRARCALRRSYLAAATRRGCSSRECRAIRSSMPSIVLGDAANATVAKVDAHTVACDDCRSVLDEMGVLATSMPTRTWFGWILTCIQTISGAAARSLGFPAAVPMIAVASLAVVGLDGDLASDGTHVDGDVGVDRSGVDARVGGEAPGKGDVVGDVLGSARVDADLDRNRQHSTATGGGLVDPGAAVDVSVGHFGRDGLSGTQPATSGVGDDGGWLGFKFGDPGVRVDLDVDVDADTVGAGISGVSAGVGGVSGLASDAVVLVDQVGADVAVLVDATTDVLSGVVPVAGVVEPVAAAVTAIAHDTVEVFGETTLTAAAVVDETVDAVDAAAGAVVSGASQELDVTDPSGGVVSGVSSVVDGLTDVVSSAGSTPTVDAPVTESGAANHDSGASTSSSASNEPDANTSLEDLVDDVVSGPTTGLVGNLLGR